MAQIEGIGAVFGLMLEELDVLEVSMLAKHDPQTLHDRLRAHNQSERLARRSPTPEEVTDWIEQARSLPVLVTGYPRASDVGTVPPVQRRAVTPAPRQPHARTTPAQYKQFYKWAEVCSL